MYGIKSVNESPGIKKMSVFCALFSVLFMLFASAPQTASADTLVRHDTTSASRSSLNSAKYRLSEDGIWRIPDQGSEQTVLFPAHTGLCALKNSPSALSLNYIRYISKNRDPKQLMILPEESTSPEPPAGQEESSAAVCCFTGDIMCLRGQQYDASVKNGYNFWPSYRLVSNIFHEADFVCGNLETLLSPSNPLTKDRKTDDNGTPLCNGPVALLRALKKAGFDMFVTANNHCCDYGIEGIFETKENLDRYHFANTGTSYPSEQSGTNEDYCIFEVNGINIAVLSYTHLINRRADLSSEELTSMVNRYDPETVCRDIAGAKAAGAEFVVVYSHWGIENTEDLTEYQIKDSEDIAEAGADLIIGSHPHCLQSGRFIETSDARRVFCIYSMGNFCSSMERIPGNNDTIILRLELTREPGGSIASECSYIPCRVMSYHSRSFVVVPVDPGLNGGFSDTRLKEADERITALIASTINGTLPRWTGSVHVNEPLQ